MADQPSSQSSGDEPMVTLAEYNVVFGALSQLYAAAITSGMPSDAPEIRKARHLLFGGFVDR